MSRSPPRVRSPGISIDSRTRSLPRPLNLPITRRPSLLPPTLTAASRLLSRTIRTLPRRSRHRIMPLPQIPIALLRKRRIPLNIRLITRPLMRTRLLRNGNRHTTDTVAMNRTIALSRRTVNLQPQYTRLPFHSRRNRLRYRLVISSHYIALHQLMRLLHLPMGIRRATIRRTTLLDRTQATLRTAIALARRTARRSRLRIRMRRRSQLDQNSQQMTTPLTKPVLHVPIRYNHEPRLRMSSR